MSAKVTVHSTRGTIISCPRAAEVAVRCKPHVCGQGGTATYGDTLRVRCSVIAFVGKATDPMNLSPHTWWSCLALQLGTDSSDSGARSAHTSGNTLRFIEEFPALLLDVSISPAWFSPAAPVALTPTLADMSCEQAQSTLMEGCLSRQHTHACAPMEPLYGSALLSIPGHTAFLSFGGRAAVDMIQDVPECSNKIPTRAWRFQYHPQLSEPVSLNISGTVIGTRSDHRAPVDV